MLLAAATIVIVLESSMQNTQLLTPEALEIVLPTLGFSLLLNLVLICALFFGPVRRWLIGQLYVYWIGRQAP